MKPVFIDLYTTARSIHATLYSRIANLQQVGAKAAHAALTELADACYAIRETEKLMDDLRTETRRLRELYDKLTCMLWTRTDGGPIRTELCTASPEIKMTRALPKQGTPEYLELCEFCRVDPNAPFRPHWPSIRDLVSEALASGTPIPAGLGETQYPEFVVTIRRKHSILDDDAIDASRLSNIRDLVDNHKVLAATDPALLESIGLIDLANAARKAAAQDVGFSPDLDDATFSNSAVPDFMRDAHE